MRLSLRLLLGYFLIVGIAAWFVLNVFVEEVKPGVRQAQEDALVDTAHLLARLASDDLRSGAMANGHFARQVTAYRQSAPSADYWGIRKSEPGLQIYVTDARGIVVFDSSGKALGADFSRWNDVARTLRGEYGARTTVENPSQYGDWTVMHVAAPIRDGERLIGVLTVSKPNRLVQPFIERSEAKIRRAGWLLLGIALVIGLLVALSLHANLQRLSRYAEAVGRGERAELPKLSVTELRALGRTLETMRERLEGRQYVEEYVSTLTHEMKTPLTAIRGAAELLDDAAMPASDRQRFSASIVAQIGRLQNLIERMLGLAALEHRRKLEETAPVELGALCRALIDELHAPLARKALQLVWEGDAIVQVEGDAFLLRQAIQNLLDNAIAFSPQGGLLEIGFCASPPAITIRDHGPGIPDYAQARIFERFYSLPRPDGGEKSSGIGLAFVREVAALHGAQIDVSDHPDGGAIATLRFLPR